MKLKTILVTGASGKVGRHLVPALATAGYQVRALRHRTPLSFVDVEERQGSVSDAAFVRSLVDGVDAVCHLATSKEDPEHFVDVSIRGTINLLEACRALRTRPQFVLASGDAALGIYFYPRPAPLAETAPLEAYPGTYALSKVVEETLVRQYGIQYGLPYTILRFSWIQAEDDLLAHLTVQPPGFGVPVWSELATDAEQKAYFRDGRNAVANLVHPEGTPYVRHVVDVEDVIDAFMCALRNPTALGETFNVAAPAAFSYGALSAYAAERLQLPVVTFVQDGFHDFSIDVTKARTVLGCALRHDAFAIVDRAITSRQKGGERTEAAYVG